jgi:hypothetical protein
MSWVQEAVPGGSQVPRLQLPEQQVSGTEQDTPPPEQAAPVVPPPVEPPCVPVEPVVPAGPPEVEVAEAADDGDDEVEVDVEEVPALPEPVAAEVPALPWLPLLPLLALVPVLPPAEVEPALVPLPPLPLLPPLPPPGFAHTPARHWVKGGQAIQAAPFCPQWSEEAGWQVFWASQQPTQLLGPQGLEQAGSRATAAAMTDSGQSFTGHPRRISRGKVTRAWGPRALSMPSSAIQSSRAWVSSPGR